MTAPAPIVHPAGCNGWRFAHRVEAATPPEYRCRERGCSWRFAGLYGSATEFVLTRHEQGWVPCDGRCAIPSLQEGPSCPPQ
jgi:hypothetical protein